MKALIDADILLHEVGYAAEVGWRGVTEGREEIPPFTYVETLLLSKIANITGMTDATDYALYHTEGRTFRYDIAKTKPYKANRKDQRPWHFKNLLVYIRDVLGSTHVPGLEADDALAIEHTRMRECGEESVLVSRDKDLRQVEGRFYSYELGKQPSFGPTNITKEGSLTLSEDGKLTGTGNLFFYSQLLTGDAVDNIPGCKGVGPVKAYNILTDEEREEPLLDRVLKEYDRVYGDKGEDIMIEQGQLLWLVRRTNEAGEPVLWYPGLEEE